MENFKENFTRMATRYVEYVEEKIKLKSNLEKEQEVKVDLYIDHTQTDATTLMNEVRTANVIAVTLTRMNTKENKENALYSTN